MTQLRDAPHRPRLAVDVPRPTPVAAAVVAVGLLLLGPAPMLVKLGRSLWAREQYQFFPLMVVGAVVVGWDRWQDVPWRSLRRGAGVVVVPLLAAALAVLAGSVLLWTRSLSLVSTLLILTAVAWRLGRWPALRATVPSLVLLAVLVPPPGHQDQWFTLRLQHLAVTVSCRLLDVLHVPNAQAGNVIEIPGKRLLIEQACSGINSLMAVLAFTLLYGFYLRRPTWRLAVTLPVAVAFVVGGNVARITAEAWLKVNHNVDASEGAAHQLLGLALFGGCIGLVASFDALLGGGEGQRATAPAQQQRPATADLRVGPAGWAIAGLFAVAGVAVEAAVWHAWQPSALSPTAAFELPPTLAGWDRVTAGASVIERPRTEAAKSFVWQYRRGDQFASVAFDYPFVGYHELVTCYALSGWGIRSEATGADAGGAPFNRVAMDKRAGTAGGGHGYLIFAQADEAGRPVRPSFAVDESTVWSRFHDRLAYAKQTAVAGASYQSQVLLQTPAEPTADERAAAEALFDAARASLTVQLTQQLGGK